MRNLQGSLRRIENILSLKHFDCGDSELNRFLSEDARFFKEEMIANTYVWEDTASVVAYFSLLTDSVSSDAVDRNLWRKLRRTFPHSKHFCSYPAVKIGRLAVSCSHKGQGIGGYCISMIKRMLIGSRHVAATRFITVDAYADAVPFYERNGFRPLRNKVEKGVLPMYYDLKQLGISE